LQSCISSFLFLRFSWRSLISSSLMVFASVINVALQQRIIFFWFST
jgi:hypothetical protein